VHTWIIRDNKKCAGCHWGRPAPNFHFMVM
jgi:hypothetical protein